MEDGKKPRKSRVVTDRDYKFYSHVSNIISKAIYKLSHMSCVHDLLLPKQLLRVTKSLVLSVLYWGIELAGRDIRNLKRLQKVQNMILRMVTKSDKKMSVRIMLEKLGLLNVQNQTRLAQMSLLRRTLKFNSCPVTLSHIAMPRMNSRDGYIRNSFPNKRKKHGDRALLPRSLELLNKMMWYKEKGKDSNAWFKQRAKKYLLSSFTNTNKIKAF